MTWSQEQYFPSEISVIVEEGRQLQWCKRKKEKAIII